MSKIIQSRIDDALFEFYLEADKDTICESLKESQLNLDDYTKKKKKMLFLARATVNKRHNEYLLNLVSKFQEAFLLNIEKPIAVFKKLVAGNPTFALYKDLDKLSKDDIIEIIKDKNLVELLEQLENNENNH